MSDLVLGRFETGGVHVTAVQLDKDNLWQVFEWADSKPFFSPRIPGSDWGLDWPGSTDTVITGLSVFTPAGKVKAEWRDWVVRTDRGDFWVIHPDTFDDRYREVHG